MSFADSDAAKIGQPVVAIGNPLGIGTSVSTGVISGLNCDLMRSPFDDYIQTDAAINPGNSGGPLLDCSGKIIGIDTALLSNNRILGSIGLGFAIPANVTRYIADRLEDPAKATPNWVGLHLQDLTAPLAIAFGLPISTGGAIVTDADPNSPAGRASLRAGDVVLAALGRPMPDARAVLRAVLMAPDGVAIPITLWRGGHTQDVTLQSQAWPHLLALRSQVLASPENIAKAEAAGLGLHLASITAADRKRYHLGGSAGALIDRVTPDSQAASLGLKPGDVIEQVGQQPTTSPAEATAQFDRGKTAPGNVVAVLVRISQACSGTRSGPAGLIRVNWSPALWSLAKADRHTTSRHSRRASPSYSPHSREPLTGMGLSSDWGDHTASPMTGSAWKPTQTA